MKTALCIEKMIEFYNGDLREINHFLKVFSFAQTIGKLEDLDEKTQEILEVSAIVHDIACPLCREKYGHADGKLQEKEGMPLAISFLSSLNYEKTLIDRVSYLVGHHHSYDNVDGSDHQILLEADFLVNAFESNYSEEQLYHGFKKIFKTRSGKQLFLKMYPIRSLLDVDIA
ncbi:MAG: HD domain-containing protein [Peptostreptococcaceae bacterium]|nr:HD domain-containing protein [Peptostreptococcaceae bacterium]